MRGSFFDVFMRAVGLLDNAVSTHERFDGRLAAFEPFVEDHGIFGSTTFQDIVAERRGCGRVENAMSFEYGECVGIEDFGPFITVVSGGVSTREDVAELGGDQRAVDTG